MDAIVRIVLGRRARSSPLYPRVPSDEVIPLFFFDDTPFYRNAYGCCTLRFNDVLDAAKLQASLVRLLEIDGWRKFGGRFRLNDQDKLEIHIPKEYSADRPAANFSNTTFDITIDEHALASSYPDVSQAAQSLELPETSIWDLGLPPGTPKCLDDYLHSDRPLLSLHITSFTDATLLSICWPHAVADAMGLRNLFKAWGLVLAGREAEVPPMLSFRDDPMATAGIDPKFQEKHAQEHLLVKGIWHLIFGIRYLLDIFWWPKMENRGVFLSPDAVQKLKAAAVASLPDPKPFISNGDVISAWIGSMAASVLPLKSRRIVIIHNAFDIRDRAPSLFPVREAAGKGAYVQNAVFPISTLVSARDLLSEGGLGLAASEVRRSIESESREGQVHALARLNRDSITEHGIIPVFGDTSVFMVILSNWSKARIFQNVDFGPAVVSRSSDTGLAVESKPVYCHHVEGLAGNDIFARNTLFFIEVPSGGYCIRGFLPPAAWHKVGEAVRRL